MSPVLNTKGILTSDNVLVCSVLYLLKQDYRHKQNYTFKSIALYAFSVKIKRFVSQFSILCFSTSVSYLSGMKEIRISGF